MNRLILVFTILFISNSATADNTKKVLCELEGNYSITYEDFRRNYFNEAVEIARMLLLLQLSLFFFLIEQNKLSIKTLGIKIRLRLLSIGL